MKVTETNVQIISLENNLRIELITEWEDRERRKYRATIWQGVNNITSLIAEDDVVYVRDLGELAVLMTQVKDFDLYKPIKMSVTETDYAHNQMVKGIVRDFIDDIKDRRGLKHAWNGLDEGMKYGILIEWADSILEVLLEQEDVEYTSSKIQHLLKKRMLGIQNFLQEWKEVDTETKEAIHFKWLEMVKKHVSQRDGE